MKITTLQGKPQVFTGTADEIVMAMTRGSHAENNPVAFMAGAAHRIGTMYGTTINYSDASSFLTELEKIGFVSIQE